jgi:hypothetical protein
MNKIKTLGILVGVLSVVNIGLLIFIFLGIPKSPGPNGFVDKEKAEKFIQEKFGFDETQMIEFRKSKSDHLQHAKELEMNLENLSRSYYTVDNPEQRDSILNRISEISRNIYENNVIHFDQVRSICTPDQLPEMEHFINGLLRQKEKDQRKGIHRKGN